jgi:hypothetical protein
MHHDRWRIRWATQVAGHGIIAVSFLTTKYTFPSFTCIPAKYNVCYKYARNTLCKIELGLGSNDANHFVCLQ